MNESLKTTDISDFDRIGFQDVGITKTSGEDGAVAKP